MSQYPPVTITELRLYDFHIVSSYDLHLVAFCIHRRLDAACSGLAYCPTKPSQLSPFQVIYVVVQLHRIGHKTLERAKERLSYHFLLVLTLQVVCCRP